MSLDLFAEKDYKSYFINRLDSPLPGGGRGARSRLAAAVGCQTAYITQVLNGSAHFSLEQAEAANEYFGHSEEEGAFLLLLVQRSRAGTPKLKARFDKAIAQTLESRKILKNRFGVGEILPQEAQVTYYSSWHYAAIHILATVPGYQSAQAIAKHLGMSPSRVSDALQFLIRVGLLVETDVGLRVGTARLHLGSDSPLVSKNHINWRLQAIRSLESGNSEDLHYSSVVSFSEKDRELIRETLVKTLESIKKQVRESPEECVHCISVDYFRV